jgi:hypothetical protein
MSDEYRGVTANGLLVFFAAYSGGGRGTFLEASPRMSPAAAVVHLHPPAELDRLAGLLEWREVLSSELPRLSRVAQAALRAKAGSRR